MKESSNIEHQAGYQQSLLSRAGNHIKLEYYFAVNVASVSWQRRCMRHAVAVSLESLLDVQRLPIWCGVQHDEQKRLFANNLLCRQGPGLSQWRDDGSNATFQETKSWCGFRCDIVWPCRNVSRVCPSGTLVESVSGCPHSRSNCSSRWNSAGDKQRLPVSSSWIGLDWQDLVKLWEQRKQQRSRIHHILQQQQCSRIQGNKEKFLHYGKFSVEYRNGTSIVAFITSITRKLWGKINKL